MGTQRATSGASSAVGDFVESCGQSLLRFAFLLTGGQGPQAEDLVQAVLTRLVERGLGGLDDPLAYARRAVVNEHRSAARRRTTEDRGLVRLANEDAVTAPQAVAPATVDRLAVFTALRELSEKERAVIVLRYYLDLPDVEIGEIVGCRRATVRSLVHRALPKLRARLGDAYRPPGTSPKPRGEGGQP